MSLHYNDRYTQIDGPTNKPNWYQYETNRHIVREHEDYINIRQLEGAQVQIGMFRHGWPSGGQTVRRIEGETGWTPRFEDHLAANLPDLSVTRIV